MRTLLFAYLIAVNVAGPRFCPCLVATGVIGGGEYAADGAFPGDPAPLPCGCAPHEPSHPAGPALEEPSPDDPASRNSGSPCRCQCGVRYVVATRPPARSSEDAAYDFAPPSLARGAVPSGSHANLRPARVAPFVTTEDLLYAFHILRC